MVALCSGQLFTHANAQEKSAKQTPGGVISGTVTVKGKPAAGVMVLSKVRALNVR
jgi:hypothetical protein